MAPAKPPVEKVSPAEPTVEKVAPAKPPVEKAAPAEPPVEKEAATTKPPVEKEAPAEKAAKKSTAAAEKRRAALERTTARAAATDGTVIPLPNDMSTAENATTKDSPQGPPVEPLEKEATAGPPVEKDAPAKPPVEKAAPAKPPVEKAAPAKPDREGPPVEKEAAAGPPVEKEATAGPPVEKDAPAKPPVEKAAPAKPPVEKAAPAKDAQAESSAAASPQAESSVTFDPTVSSPKKGILKRAREACVNSPKRQEVAEKVLRASADLPPRQSRRAQWNQFWRSSKGTGADKMPQYVKDILEKNPEAKTDYLNLFCLHHGSWGKVQQVDTSRHKYEKGSGYRLRWLMEGQIKFLMQDDEVAMAHIAAAKLDPKTWRENPKLSHLEKARQYQIPVEDDVWEERKGQRDFSTVFQGNVDAEGMSHLVDCLVEPDGGLCGSASNMAMK